MGGLHSIGASKSDRMYWILRGVIRNISAIADWYMPHLYSKLIPMCRASTTSRRRSCERMTLSVISVSSDTAESTVAIISDFFIRNCFCTFVVPNQCNSTTKSEFAKFIKELTHSLRATADSLMLCVRCVCLATKWLGGILYIPPSEWSYPSMILFPARRLSTFMGFFWSISSSTSIISVGSPVFASTSALASAGIRAFISSSFSHSLLICS